LFQQFPPFIPKKYRSACGLCGVAVRLNGRLWVGDWCGSSSLYGFENGFVVVYDVLEDAEDGWEFFDGIDFFVGME